MSARSRAPEISGNKSGGSITSRRDLSTRTQRSDVRDDLARAGLKAFEVVHRLERALVPEHVDDCGGGVVHVHQVERMIVETSLAGLPVLAASNRPISPAATPSYQSPGPSTSGRRRPTTDCPCRRTW